MTILGVSQYGSMRGGPHEVRVGDLFSVVTPERSLLYFIPACVCELNERKMSDDNERRTTDSGRWLEAGNDKLATVPHFVTPISGLVCEHKFGDRLWCRTTARQRKPAHAHWRGER